MGLSSTGIPEQILQRARINFSLHNRKRSSTDDNTNRKNWKTGFETSPEKGEITRPTTQIGLYRQQRQTIKAKGSNQILFVIVKVKVSCA